MAVDVVVKIGETQLAAAAVDSSGESAARGVPSPGVWATVRSANDPLEVLDAREARDTSLATGSLGALVRRCSDPVPVVIGSRTYSATDLLALQVRAFVELVADLAMKDVGPVHVHRLVLVHPETLTADARTRLARSLTAHLPGVSSVDWTTRSAAVLGTVPRADRAGRPHVVGLLHVGGQTCEASVWEVGEGTRQLGASSGLRDRAGAAVDRAVLGHVLRQTGVDPGELDASRPDTLAELLALEASCRLAKETLSLRTSTAVTVGLGVGRRVRLVRPELDELSSSVVREQAGLLHAALVAAETAALSRIVVHGGFASNPLLVQHLSADFDCPVDVHDSPALACVLGEVERLRLDARRQGSARAESARVSTAGAPAGGEPGDHTTAAGSAGVVAVARPVRGVRVARIRAALVVASALVLALVAGPTLMTLIRGALGVGDGSRAAAALGSPEQLGDALAGFLRPWATSTSPSAVPSRPVRSGVADVAGAVLDRRSSQVPGTEAPGDQRDASSPDLATTTVVTTVPGVTQTLATTVTAPPPTTGGATATHDPAPTSTPAGGDPTTSTPAPEVTTPDPGPTTPAAESTTGLAPPTPVQPPSTDATGSGGAASPGRLDAP